MPAIEKGRMCVKKTGRDAGEKCVIVKIIDENFVEVSTVASKKHAKCSIRHLEPLAKIIDVSSDASIKSALSK